MPAKKNNQEFAKLAGAGHVDDMQYVNRTPVFAVEANPINVPVEFRNTTAYVGPQTKQAIEVNSPSACKSILNAVVDLHFGMQFPVLFVGLHLRASLDQLAGIPYHQNIGVLGSTYKPMDEHDRFARFIPAEGWVRLGVNFGTLTARPIVFMEPIKGESDYVRHDRKSIMLHSAIDALLNGFCYHIKPVFFKGDGEVADGAKTLVERQVAFIAKYKEVMEGTYEQSVVSYQKTVLNAQERNAFGRVRTDDAEAIEKGETPTVVDTVLMLDGTQCTFEDLNGKVVRKWFGRLELGTKLIGDDREKFVEFAKVVKVRRYALEVITTQA
jgi:hypothetical protein